jgi:hypothetical protein
MRLRRSQPARLPVAEGKTKGPTMEPPTKEKKTAEGLAVMIREDFGKMDGCPERGVIVTVYGFNPWNAMLTFGVDAGPVPNKAELDIFLKSSSSD